MPDVFVVLGGANCEGAMGAEVVRQFPFVDAIVSGEGDIVFPALVQHILERRPILDLQGVYTCVNAHLLRMNGRYPNAPSVHDMDALPIPEYDDFFEQLGRAHLEVTSSPRLLLETSRGCWWGQKKHCTFCGLNGATMTYRSKSAERALTELSHLVDTYPDRPISVVDNILDMAYFHDLIPELARRQLDVELFYEVKANLRKEQVRLLRDAGVARIQPGIESLSSAVLTLMGKGVKALQNIQLLKWCKELGVRPSWNMLWGFPNEPPVEYARVAELVPLLTHLPPPTAAATIRLDRFSPNYDDATRLGFTDVAPYPSYAHIYPFERDVVANLAYFFTFQYRDQRDVAGYTAHLARQIAIWQELHAASDLFYIDKCDQLLVWDLRPGARQPLVVISGLQKALFVACDGIRTIAELERVAQSTTNGTVPKVDTLLQPLLEHGLMIREGNSYLGLAIPLGDYTPKEEALEKLHESIRRVGVSSGSRYTIALDAYRLEGGAPREGYSTSR